MLLFAGIIVAAGSSRPSFAQAMQFGVAAGIVAPTGDYAETRTIGPVVRGALTLRPPERRIRFRGELESAWLIADAGTAASGPGASQYGTLHALSMLGSILIGGTEPDVAFYLIAGVGVQRLRVEDAQNPYGTTGGLRGGAGVRWRLGRAALHAEVTPHWAVTDFATGHDFGIGMYIPMVVGISF